MVDISEFDKSVLDKFENEWGFSFNDLCQALEEVHQLSIDLCECYYEEDIDYKKVEFIEYQLKVARLKVEQAQMNCEYYNKEFEKHGYKKIKR